MSSNAALVAAQSRHDTLQMAASALAMEANKAGESAARAADTVHKLAYAIDAAEVKDRARKRMDAAARQWAEDDVIAGFIRMDHIQPGGGAPGLHLPSRHGAPGARRWAAIVRISLEIRQYFRSFQ